MAKEIILSKDTFWDWVALIIKNSEESIFSSMYQKSEFVPYLTELNNSQRDDDFSIFQSLKERMPREYFREMEYCALAFSKIFQTVFPPLARQVEQLAYIEWLCYVEPENPEYRDHFVHMLKVAFLCQKVIENKKAFSRIVNWQFGSKHFIRWYKKERIYFSEARKSDIMQDAILLASIFHDFGYGYKFLRGYEEKLSKLNLLGCDSIDTTKDRAKIIERSLLGEFILSHHAWFQNNAQVSPIQKENILLGFIHDCLPLNHSIASSLVVLDIAEDLYRSQAIIPELYLAFQIAAESCLLHDLTKSERYLYLDNRYNSKHFLDFSCHEKVPAAILLIFADELSIWDRPLIRFDLHNKDEVKTIIHHKWREGQDYPSKIRIKFPEKEASGLIISLENNEQNEILRGDLEKCHCFNKDGVTALKIFGHKIGFKLS